MKKQPKSPKLQLRRETLRRLQDKDASQAAGGFVSWWPCCTAQNSNCN